MDASKRVANSLLLRAECHLPSNLNHYRGGSVGLLGWQPDLVQARDNNDPATFVRSCLLEMYNVPLAI